MKKDLILILTGLVLAGCSQVVNVHKSTNGGEVQKVAGIPFHTKKKVCTRNSSIAERWIKAEMKVVGKRKGSQKAEYSKVYTVRVRKSKLDDIEKVNKYLFNNIEKIDKDVVNGAVSLFEAIKGDTSGNYMTISRTKECKWVVDETSTYYLNAPMPLFGKGELTQKLSEEGTLMEATAKADNSTLAEGISSLFPLKEYFDAKYVAPKIKALEGEEEQIDKHVKPPVTQDDDKLSYTVTLKVDEEGYLYKLSREIKEGEKDSGYPTFWDRDKTDVSMTKTKLVESNEGGTSEKKEEKAISIEGKIKLP